MNPCPLNNEEPQRAGAQPGFIERLDDEQITFAGSRRPEENRSGESCAQVAD